MGEPDPEKPEDLLTFHNRFGDAVTVCPRVELYSVKDFMGEEMPGLAVVLDEVIDASMMEIEQHAVLTVSFGEFIGEKNAAYIDTKNCRFAALFLEAGIARDTGLTKSSGFCEYPLWVFDEGEHSNGAYEVYEQEYDAYMETAEQEDGEVEEQGMSW